MKARAGWREKQLPPPDEDRDLDELIDAQLEDIIRGARRYGTLPTQHSTINLVIIDPKGPAGPTIDGQAREVTPD